MSKYMQRIGIILLFVITFVLIGHTAPILHATYAPSGQMIDVHEFDAEDTTVNADEHNICFDRTVRNGVTAEVVTDLYLINDKDQRVKVDSNKEDRYIQEGNKEVIIPYELPDGIVVGEYRYIMVTEVELANGRVTRAFEFESKPFTVSKEENTTQQISNTC